MPTHKYGVIPYNMTKVFFEFSGNKNKIFSEDAYTEYTILLAILLKSRIRTTRNQPAPQNLAPEVLGKGILASW